jgi:hypothetical protein
LGGDENFPKEPNDLKVTFGKVEGDLESAGGFPYTGFGLEGKVKRIRNGKTYGGRC